MKMINFVVLVACTCMIITPMSGCTILGTTFFETYLWQNITTQGGEAYNGANIGNGDGGLLYKTTGFGFTTDEKAQKLRFNITMEFSGLDQYANITLHSPDSKTTIYTISSSESTTKEISNVAPGTWWVQVTAKNSQVYYLISIEQYKPI